MGEDLSGRARDRTECGRRRSGIVAQCVEQDDGRGDVARKVRHRERRVEAKWCQERTADASAGHRQRVAETRTLFAYGARPPDGNKGGKRPALEEENRRRTLRCLQARLAVALRRSNVAGAVSAVGVWRWQWQRAAQTRAWLTKKGRLTMTTVASDRYARVMAGAATRCVCRSEQRRRGVIGRKGG